MRVKATTSHNGELHIMAEVRAYQSLSRMFISVEIVNISTDVV